MNAARSLRYPLTNPTSNEAETEEVSQSDASFVWPIDSDERIQIMFCLSLNEYNMIANSIDVGADIAYGNDSVSVNWIWLRNMIDGSASMCGCCPSPTPSFNDRIVSQTYITNTSDTYTEVYNTWNTGGQTVSSIAPDLDYDTGSPEDIDKLMCLAIDMLMTAIVESAKLNKSGTDAQNRDVVKNLSNVFAALGTAGGAALAVGGVAAGVVGFIGGPFLILGLALSAVGLSIANLVWTTDLSVFKDAQAIQDVKCVITNNLLGNTPTRELFISALGGAGFEPGTNAYKLATIVQQYLYDLNTYLQFLTMAQGLYDVSDFGVLPDCTCIEPPPEGCTDFVAGEGLWSVFDDVGTYEPGEGYKGQYFGAYDETVLFIEREATSGLGNAAGYTFTLDDTVDIHSAYLFVNDVSAGSLFGLDDTGVVVFDESTVGGTWPKDANYKVRLQLTVGGADTWRAIEACVIPE